MKKKDTKKKSLISIVFYVLSAIMAVCLLITVYKAHTYVGSLVQQGLVIGDQLFNVVTYYMEAVIPYLFYTIITFGIGYIINKLDNRTNETTEVPEVIEVSNEIQEGSEEKTEPKESIETVNDETINEEKIEE